MKKIVLLLLTLCLTSCDADTAKTHEKEGTQRQIKEISYPCLVVEKPNIIKVTEKDGSHIYYAILHGGGDQVYDDLRLIVSKFDFSKYLKVDSNVNYSSEKDQKKLVKCLQTYNENSLVQDLWSDMKESLDEEDNTRWVTDKDGNNHPEEGFYPKYSISIENPNIDTFKVDNLGAEIKSLLISNHSDTQVTTIKWLFKDGKYVFDKYTTSIRKED